MTPRPASRIHYPSADMSLLRHISRRGLASQSDILQMEAAEVLAVR